MNTIHINDNYFLKYGIKFEKSRQIFLHYMASVNEDKPEEYRKPEKTEHNRRDSREIIDVHLNKIREFSGSGKIFKIHRRHHRHG